MTLYREDPCFQGLLQAILQDPSDDTPRLILSDWLSDRDHPWGEFIRLQISIHSYDPHYCLDFSSDVSKIHDNSSDPDVRLACNLARKLYENRYVLFKNKYLFWETWKRGFVEALKTSFSSWLAGNREYTQNWPLSKVILTDRPFIMQDWKSAWISHYTGRKLEVPNDFFPVGVHTEECGLEHTLKYHWPQITFFFSHAP